MDMLDRYIYYINSDFYLDARGQFHRPYVRFEVSQTDAVRRFLELESCMCMDVSIIYASLA